MPQQKIDYDALAEQVRGGSIKLSGVDYDALAAEARRQRATEATTERPRDAVGFLNNLVTSGVKFGQDTAEGLVQIARLGSRLAQAQRDPEEALRLGQDFVSLVRNTPEIATALATALKDRYGSPEAVLNTLYEDPVGVLADISTVTGVGATVAGARAPRLAAGLSRIERITNPLSIVAGTMPRIPERLPVVGHVPGVSGRQVPGLSQLLDAASDTAIKVAVRPTAAVKKMAGEGRPALNKDIARAIRETGSITAEGAEKRIRGTQAKINEAVSQRPNERVFIESDVVPRVMEGIYPEYQALGNIGGDVGEMQAKVRDHITRLQHPAVFEPKTGNFTGYDLKTLKEPLTLDEALAAKRKAQRRAYEPASRSESFDLALDKKTAQAFREAVNDRVSDLEDLHRTEQTQLIAKAALQAAEEGGTKLPFMLAVPTAGTSLLFNPTAGAAVGIGLDRAGRVIANPTLQRGALGARLTENTEEEVDPLFELLLRRAMEGR